MPTSRLADISRYDRSIAFLVMCFLYACYLLTFTGVIQSSDGLSMFATTENIVRRGDVDSNQLLWMGIQQGSFAADGELYSRKGAGMGLLALPLVWLAQQWTALGLVQMALLLNPILTAWTGGLVYRTVIRLGWSRFVAVVTALAFGLATPAWPYTQTFFSDPVAMWGLFGALYSVLAYSQSRRKRYLFLGGIAWGLAYLARSINLVTLPVYILALALALAEMEKRHDLRTIVVGRLREWIFFGFPILAAGLFSLWWNWLRYGGLFETGYVETESFSGVWLEGIFGLLISPGRGILWYSPVIVLALAGIGWFRRNLRWFLVAVAGVTLLYLGFYAKWYMWHGGYSWGPRFLVPVLPFVMALSAPIWQRIFESQHWGQAGRVGAAGLLVLSLGVQWLGALVPFSLVQDWLAQTVTPLFAAETFTQWRYSPLVLQWNYLSAEHLHFAWWRAGVDGPDWPSLILVMATLAVGGWLLLRQVRQDLPTGERTPNWVYGGALILVTLGLLVRYQPVLSDGSMATARLIEAHEAEADAVLYLRPTETQQFANAYHGDLPVYGLFPVDPLDENASGWLAHIAQRYRRVWVVPDFQPPDRSGWERTLRGQSFLLLDTTAQPDGQRVALYAFPQAQPLTETGVGIEFGEPAWVRLNGYGYTERTSPGAELLVALEWESLRPVTENFHVFVHLLNAQGERVDQRDGQPLLWLRPTSTWTPGERIEDRYGLLLPEDLPPGRYRVIAGLYDPASGERQPVSVGPGAAVELGPIRVERTTDDGRPTTDNR